MTLIIVYSLAQDAICFVDSELSEIAPFTVLAQHFHGSTAIFRLLERSDPFIRWFAKRYFKDFREYGLVVLLKSRAIESYLVDQCFFGGIGISHGVPACGLGPTDHV